VRAIIARPARYRRGTICGKVDQQFGNHVVATFFAGNARVITSSCPAQNSKAFSMRLAAGMLQELPKHFAATSDGQLHFRESIKETNAQITRRTRRDYLT